MSNTAKGKFLFLDLTDVPSALDDLDTHTEEITYDAAETFDIMVRSLVNAGYDPVTQMTTYLISDDPTFLPEEADVRGLAHHIGRDKLLAALLTFYMEHRAHEC